MISAIKKTHFYLLLTSAFGSVSYDQGILYTRQLHMIPTWNHFKIFRRSKVLKVVGSLRLRLLAFARLEQRQAAYLTCFGEEIQNFEFR